MFHDSWRLIQPGLVFFLYLCFDWIVLKVRVRDKMDERRISWGEGGVWEERESDRKYPEGVVFQSIRSVFDYRACFKSCCHAIPLSGNIVTRDNWIRRAQFQTSTCKNIFCQMKRGITSKCFLELIGAKEGRPYIQKEIWPEKCLIVENTVQKYVHIPQFSNTLSY